MPKLSGQMLALIEPFMPKLTTKGSFEALVGLAVIAWNHHLMPKKEGREMVESLLEKLFVAAAKTQARQFVSGEVSNLEEVKTDFAGDAQGITGVLVALIGRRRTLFPDDRRWISEHWVDWPSDHEPCVRVASFPVPELLGE